MILMTVMTMILIVHDNIYREKDDVLSLHNKENTKDHPDDEKNSNNDSNCSSGV